MDEKEVYWMYYEQIHNQLSHQGEVDETLVHRLAEQKTKERMHENDED